MAEYFEIVLDGNTHLLRGFVAGYLAASGLHEEVFVASEFHVEHDSLAHQVAEWIGLVADRTHLIVPAQVKERLEAGAGQTGEELGIRFVETRRITEARFEFSWKTYSREAAENLRRLFADPPAGVTLENYAPSEYVHEDEKTSTAGYAPVHPYKAEASGTVHGAPGGVIPWAARLRMESFIEVHEIRLEYAD